jgi:RNA polymerase-binding transcription factor DksA
MNQQLLDENKKKLMAEQKRLRAILSHEGKFDGKGEFPGEYKPQFSEIGTEEGENASEVEQYANDLAVTTHLEEKLKRVEESLKRIEEGTYGKNPDGSEVDENRLRALPEAG